MLNSQLEQLLDSDIPEVRILAKNYQELENKLNTKQISISEFNELTDDLVDIVKIEKDMHNLSILIKLKEAAMIIIQIKTVMSLF